MCIFKKVERFLFPCQKRIDAMMQDNASAWGALTDVVKEKKELVTTNYPQFAHVQGRRHVNPR